MQKGQTQVLILAGIVLLLAIAGGIFYMGRVTTPKPQNMATSSSQPSPTPDETVYTESDRSANWKTYTNTDGKYSIGYPMDYSLEETDSIKIPEKFPAGNKQIAIKPSEQKLNFILYINYYPVPNLSQANEVIQQVSACDSVNAQKRNYAPKAKDFIIDNQKATMYEDSLCAQFTATNFYILHNNRVYSISVASTEKYNLHKTTVDQILSTFKFLP